MTANFKFANRFATVNSRYTYEYVFFDRFNSVFKGFYLVVGQQQLIQMLRNNQPITFYKIPSTERFGSQDVTVLDYPNQISQEQRDLLGILNGVIASNNYYVVDG